MTSITAEPPADAGSGRSMGHVALHYGEAADGPLAARLLSTIGLVETQMLPLPGGNFYRFVVEGKHFARGDGIVYLSALPEPQRKLIDAIHTAFGVGTDTEHDVVKGWREMMTADPEASFHFGFLLESLEDLERIVQALRSDPELKDRTNVVLNRPRLGDREIDVRLDASPVFGGVTRYAYGRAGVQAFIETDLLKAGQLGDSMLVELDFVFPDQAEHILSVVEL